MNKATLADSTANKIRELIFSGELKPGERANIDALSRKFQISQTPVREALKKLISEGIVVYRPKVGYSARNLTLHEYLQVSETHQVLEVYLVRKLADNPNLVDFQSLGHINDELYNAILQKNITKIGNCNDSFHRKLYEKYPNKTMLMRLHGLWDEVLSLRNLMYKSSLFTNRIVEEHKRILEAIRSGDPDSAARAMNEHYRSGREGAIASFPVDE